MARAYIGLGSNLGDREANIRRAIDLLGEHPGVKIAAASSLVESEPAGGLPQGPYLNAAAALETTLEPRELLAACQDIERELGRERGERWAPRTIDLDILLYDERVIDEPDLKVPHPLMTSRRFVLEPLAEIGPDAVHPVLEKTVKEILAGQVEDAQQPEGRRRAPPLRDKSAVRQFTDIGSASARPSTQVEVGLLQDLAHLLEEPDRGSTTSSAARSNVEPTVTHSCPIPLKTPPRTCPCRYSFSRRSSNARVNRSR